MPTPHELLLRVRYSETDQMRVVHHTSYLIYMEEGRTALMRTLGFPYDEVERRGLAMAVRRVDLRYRMAARYGDQVVVRTWVDRFRGASIQYQYEILRESNRELLVTGSAEVACLRLEGDMRPTPIPEDIRLALERHVGNQPPGAAARATLP